MTDILTNDRLTDLKETCEQRLAQPYASYKRLEMDAVVVLAFVTTVRAQAAQIERDGNAIVELHTEVSRQAARIEEQRSYLALIAEGRGRFSQDHMTHANNTIEDIKKLAQEALDGVPFEDRAI